MKQSYKAWIALGAVCIFFFILQSLMPYMTDNFVFSRDMRPSYADLMAGAPIRSLEPMTFGAAWRQSVEMYSTWCGRFTGNLLTYLLFMLPRPLYAALAAIAFGAYIILLVACVHGKSWRNFFTSGQVLTLAALLWTGMAAFGTTFFWPGLGGWTALLAQALFFLPYRLALGSDTISGPVSGQTASFGSAPLLAPGLFLFGAFATSLDYASAVALPAASLLCCVWLSSRKYRPAGHNRLILWAGVLGACLGGAATILAPGNAARIRLTNDEAVQAWAASPWLERIGDYLAALPRMLLIQIVPLALLAWALALLFKRFGAGVLARMPAAAMLFLAAASATIGAYLFTSRPPARAFCTSTAQLIVAALVLYAAALPLAGAKARKVIVWGKMALCLYCAFTLPYELSRFWKAHEANAQRERIYAEHKGQDVKVGGFPVSGDRYMPLGYQLNDIGPDPSFWVNRQVAAHYGLKSVSSRNDNEGKILLGLPEGSQHGNLEASLEPGGKMRLKYDSPGKEPPQDLHVYYFANCATLDLLPDFAARAILAWLEKKPDGLRKNLVPLLLARKDFHLKPTAGGASGASGVLTGIYSTNDRLWLVAPGDPFYSFNLLPLRTSAPGH